MRSEISKRGGWRRKLEYDRDRGSYQTLRTGLRGFGRCHPYDRKADQHFRPRQVKMAAVRVVQTHHPVRPEHRKVRSN